MPLEILNFGCRLNIAEGEAIRQVLQPHNAVNDVLVVNSCAVTAEAERQARQAIRRAARHNPSQRIIVTGCGADIAPTRFEAMPQVAGLIANDHKLSADAYLLSNHPPQRARGGSAYSPLTSGADHARAFISIQTGCDHSCTFCIIPSGRGNSRSAAIADVVSACQAAVARGQSEVVLTGVDLTSYDYEGKPLGSLVSSILNSVPNLPRLRLSSLDCIEIDPLLEELLVHEPRMMPHLHLSFQAGDDMILKRMKRRHSRAQAITLVQRLQEKRPEIVIGADIIAGFPTEDDAMFANTCAFIEDANIMFGHIFPYSPRPGTPAARMPQVSPQVAKMRAATLRDTIAQRRTHWFDSLIGSTQSVLMEMNGTSGHAPNFASVKVSAPIPPNTIHTICITGHDGQHLFGAPV